MDPSTVLVLEDDPMLERLLLEVLGEAGYQISAATPFDCLGKIQACVPDVIVIACDDRGTFRCGWQVAYTLRQACPNSALIMLSTNWKAVQEVGHTSRGRIFDAGLRKPFSITALLQTVVACRTAQRNHQESISQEKLCETTTAAGHPGGEYTPGFRR